MNDKRIFAGKEQLKPQLRRALINLEDEDWQKADFCCERALDEEPEDPYAYLIKLMAALNIRDEETLMAYEKRLDGNPLFRKAVDFAEGNLKEGLISLADGITEKLNRRQAQLEEAERTDSYYRAKNLMHFGASVEELQKAIAFIEKAKGFQDAEELKKVCEERISTLRREASEQKAALNRARTRMGLLIGAVVIAAIVLFFNLRLRACDARADALEKSLIGKSFSCSYSDAEFKQGNLTASYVEYIDETLTITADGVTVLKTRSIDYDGTIILMNGVKQFDEVKKTTENSQRDDVVVPLFGDPYVMIDGFRYTLTLNSDDIPVGLVRGTRKYQ